MVETIPNWHPVFVHFTVALLIIAATIQLPSLFLSNGIMGMAIVARWNLWLGGMKTSGVLSQLLVVLAICSLLNETICLARTAKTIYSQLTKGGVIHLILRLKTGNSNAIYPLMLIF